MCHGPCQWALQSLQAVARLSVSLSQWLLLWNCSYKASQWPTLAMENQQVTAVMVLGLLAAFDMVNHEILLCVLKHNFGLEDTVLNLFDLYLCPRSCKVNIRRKYLSEQNLPFSVPQWSCAGAQIFNLYFSTVQEVCRWHIVEDKFKADHHEDEVRCIYVLEKCVVDLKVWMDKN